MKEEMTKLIIKITILLLVFKPLTIFSQEVKTIRDIGVWTSVGIEYKQNKKWSYQLTQRVRTNDNAIKLQKVITDFELSHRINKHYSLGFGIRYAYDRKKNQTFTNDMRYQFDFNVKQKLTKKLSLKYRLRFQHTYNNLFTYILDIDRKSNLRNKISINYKLKGHQLFLATELFREYEVYKKPYFNNLRISVGDKIKTKQADITASIAFERELQEDVPLNLFLFRINYNFNFKK